MREPHTFTRPREQEAHAFYRRVVRHLQQDRAPFLVGGTYALTHLTGVRRETKDLDLFVRPEDADRVYRSLNRAGIEVQMFARHWLAKARDGDQLIDVIHSSGNGVARVDELWFTHSEPGKMLGAGVQFCPPEEMIWSKSFVMERERYDGADVAHLLKARARTLDWNRLLWRFGGHWRVLLAHLVLFGYVYPGLRTAIPGWLMAALVSRMRREQTNPAQDWGTCRGTLLSRAQYLVDLDQGYGDGRLPPDGPMEAEDIAAWTARADQEPTGK